MSARSEAVVLRDAAVGDLAALAALEAALFDGDAWSAVGLVDAVTPSRSPADRLALVVEVGGEVVGYAVLTVAGEVADLERIAVDPAHRRAGLATTLLAAARARALAAGAERLLLEVGEANAGARAFYATHGAAELDRRRRYYRDGSDALVLQLPLAAASSDQGRDRG